MKERAFNARPHEIRGLLDGRVTQLRRVVNHRIFSNGIRYSREFGDIVCHNDYWPPSAMLMEVRKGRDVYHVADVEGWDGECPLGQPGDRLWCREAWWHYKAPYLEQAGFKGGTIARLEDGTPCAFHANEDFDPSYCSIWRKRSSTQMPRWASRLTLEVLDVRVQRLQDATEADATAEGSGSPITRDCKLPKLRELWDAHNKRHPWESNPWTWVAQVKMLEVRR